MLTKNKFNIGDEIYFFNGKNINKATVYKINNEGKQVYYMLYEIPFKKSENDCFGTKEELLDSFVVFDYTKKSFEKNQRVTKL